jgi:hypothetical protein
VFTTPWSARITYRRPLGSWPEFVCAESTRDYVGRTILAYPVISEEIGLPRL